VAWSLVGLFSFLREHEASFSDTASKRAERNVLRVWEHAILKRAGQRNMKKLTNSALGGPPRLRVNTTSSLNWPFKWRSEAMRKRGLMADAMTRRTQA
jgi:hypothetical protein